MCTGCAGGMHERALGQMQLFISPYIFGFRCRCHLQGRLWTGSTVRAVVSHADRFSAQQTTPTVLFDFGRTQRLVQLFGVQNSFSALSHAFTRCTIAPSNMSNASVRHPRRDLICSDQVDGPSRMQTTYTYYRVHVLKRYRSKRRTGPEP